MEHYSSLSITAISILLLVVWQWENALATETSDCSCYSFQQIRKTWVKSDQYCQQNGWNLVSMETEEEYQFINKTIQSLNVLNNEWYIGLKRTYSGNKEYWLWTNGQIMTIHKWRQPYEPNGDGPCVKMIKDYEGLGLFNDAKCTNTYMSICEYKTVQTCPSNTKKWCPSNNLITTTKDYFTTTTFSPTRKETDHCSCYSFQTNEKKWGESNQYCQQNGGNLVSMETEEEYQFINKTIQSLDVRDNEWNIGLRRSRAGDWKWITGHSMTIDKWLPTQPRASGDCVKMIKGYRGLGLFDGIRCLAYNMFICEYKEDTPACAGRLKWCPWKTTEKPATTTTGPHKIGFSELPITPQEARIRSGKINHRRTWESWKAKVSLSSGDSRKSDRLLLQSEPRLPLHTNLIKLNHRF